MTTAVLVPRCRIAVLLTCHNRRSVTLAALGGIFAQESAAECVITTFLVDDGSTDGTADAVSREFPQVRLLKGDGTLFWSGGMRMATAAAMSEGFDYYLWLNDDTFLEKDALLRLLTTERELTAQGHGTSIVVGATRDPHTGTTTYGGVVRAGRFHPLKFQLLQPAPTVQRCSSFNGNVVLISAAAARVVGNISDAFTHTMGDTDYGLRAGALGCSVWVAPGHVGTCKANPCRNTWRDNSLPARTWLAKVFSIKGLPPGDYARFTRRHGGPLWPVLWVAPYIRVGIGFLRHRIATRFQQLACVTGREDK